MIINENIFFTDEYSQSGNSFHVLAKTVPSSRQKGYSLLGAMKGDLTKCHSALNKQAIKESYRGMAQEWKNSVVKQEHVKS